MHKGERGIRFEKFVHNNAIKHKIGDPLGFLTTPSSPPPPQKTLVKTPWTLLDFQLLCIYGFSSTKSLMHTQEVKGAWKRTLK
jgi:hypothetical protein